MHYFDTDEVVLLSMPNAGPFATKVYDALIQHEDCENLSLGKVEVRTFKDGEVRPRITENVRRRRVYVVHGTTDSEGNYRPNDCMVQLLLTDDALRRSSAAEITYIMPYFPYQRQDRMDKPRTPVSAARLLRSIIDPWYPIPTRLITVDMHVGQIQGFVPYPLDHLNATSLFVDYFRESMDTSNLVVVSPDAGGAERARHMAKKLGCGTAIIDKRRHTPNEAEVMNVLGDVNGRACLVRDDVIDTAGTLESVGIALVSNGARELYACATHGLFSPRDPEITTEQRLKSSGIKVVTADTIYRSGEYLEENGDWLTVLSVAPMIAEAVYQIETLGSVSKLIE